MRNVNPLRRLVLALSGADTEVLRYVPSERTRFESLGWAILITSCMAMISMWFALSSALSVNGILAIPIAVFWGLVIMGIDRWLIVSMPVDSNRKFALALPRLLLALLLGTLISTPLVLRVFQAEINAQMALMQENSYSSFLTDPQSKEVDQQVTTYGNELQQVETVVNSKGAETGNTAADPTLIRYNQELTQLDAQLNHWTSLKNTYYAEYNCQLYGGTACPKAGAGPEYKASHANYVQASAEVTSYTNQITQVQNEIKQRNTELTSTSASSQQERYDDAKNQLPVVQSEYTAAVQRRDQFQTAFYAQNEAAHGILSRLEALSELSDQNFTVAAARFLLFLLFLVIECLPVTVKLLQKPGEYEAALLASKKADRRDYEKFFSTRSRMREAGLATDGQRLGAQGMPAGPEPQTDAIWNGTRRLPNLTNDPEDIIPTETYQDPRPRGGRRADSGSPEDTVRTEQQWHGDDNWRNNWVPDDEEQIRENRYRNAAGDPRVAQTRRDSAVPPTRLDYDFADESPVDLYQGEDGTGFTEGYREASLPALEAADYDSDSVPARADSNSGGIPLSWDDE
jgi:hypothetical protein